MSPLLILTLLLSSLTFVDRANANGFRAGHVQELPSQDVEEFLGRWRDQRHANLLVSATWVLTHNYSDSKRVDEVLESVQTYFEAFEKYEKGDRPALARVGGIKAYKDELAGWLNDDDQAVRAYAAVMLGISGDKSYAPRLADLLRVRKYKDSDRLHYDRGRAATALGVVGAEEYVPTLVALLNSPNEFDRAGAAYGLGFLRAKAQAQAVAKLLDDEEERVRGAAKESLGMMGAGELIKGKGAGKP